MSQTLDSKTAPVFAYRREQLEEMATNLFLGLSANPMFPASNPPAPPA